MIIFYLILPLLNCGKLSPACKAAHMSLSAMLRMLNNSKYLWNKLLTCVSYELFFALSRRRALFLAFLSNYQSADSSYRSRHRIVLMGDDTLWPRSDECQSENVKKLFDHAMGCYRKGSNPVVLHCRIGDIDLDFPIDIRVWQPKDSKEYKSKDELLCKNQPTPSAYGAIVDALAKPNSAGLTWLASILSLMVVILTRMW